MYSGLFEMTQSVSLRPIRQAQPAEIVDLLRKLSQFSTGSLPQDVFLGTQADILKDVLSVLGQSSQIDLALSSSWHSTEFVAAPVKSLSSGDIRLLLMVLAMCMEDTLSAAYSRENQFLARAEAKKQILQQVLNLLGQQPVIEKINKQIVAQFEQRLMAETAEKNRKDQ